MVEYQKVEVGSRERNPGTVPYQKVHIVNDVWVLLTGDEMTGALTINVAADDHIILQRDSIQNKIQQLTPGSFPEGHLVFNVDHSGNITTVGTVDGVDVSAIPGTYVAKAGDTMTGDLTMSAAFILLGFANGIYVNDAYFGAAAGGKFTVWNSTPAVVFQIDGSGNITTVGNVDGVDVSSFKTAYDTHAANTSAHHLQTTKISQITIDTHKHWANRNISYAGIITSDHVQPKANLTYSLGLPSMAWLNLWVSAITAGTLQNPSGDLNLLTSPLYGIHLGSTTEHPNIHAHGHIFPTVDATYDCGVSGLRWGEIWAWITHFGELGFSDITCPVCKHKFKKNDALVLMVQSATKKEIMTVPAHLNCLMKGTD